jgi:hypothetical protein
MVSDEKNFLYKYRQPGSPDGRTWHSSPVYGFMGWLIYRVLKES